MADCTAWGEFTTDERGESLRRAGVSVAGPCKLAAGHEGDHSLAAASTPTRPQRRDLTDDFEISALWCNDDSANLYLECRRCGATVLERNSNDDDPPSLGELCDAAGAHRVDCIPSDTVEVTDALG